MVLRPAVHGREHSFLASKAHIKRRSPYIQAVSWERIAQKSDGYPNLCRALPCLKYDPDGLAGRDEFRMS